MSCTFEYKGKKYSREYILQKLAKEILQEKDQSQSILWLKEKLGMSDSEISIVKGLIENKSLGRFKEDGKILLSGFADTIDAYHEGFHRVFRRSLNDIQRQEVRNSFKSRKNWRSLIDQYRENYPNLSDDDLIEEYLADEFSNYVLNPDGYIIEQPIRTVFQRIIDFIKSLLGMSKRDIRKLYRDIEQGKFKNKKSSQPYNKSADKILIGDYETTISDKIEIVNEVVRQIINRVAGTSAKALEDFVSGKTMINDFAILKKVLQESIIPIINNTNPDLAKALEKDFIKGYQTSPANSVIYKLYRDQLTRIGINTSVVEKDSSIEDIEDFTTDQNDTETPNTKGEFVSSIEVDPKSNLSKRVKILLASFIEPNQTTPLGFPKPVLWSQAFTKISESLAGVPTEYFLDELRQSDLSFKDQLLSFLDKDDYATLTFRNDFISNLARTINNFVIAEIKDGDIIFFNANNNTKIDKIVKGWQSGMIKTISDYSFNTWKERVSSLLSNKNITPTVVKDILGFDIDEDIDYVPLVYRIADVIKRSKYSNENQPDYTNLFKAFDIQGSVKQLATLQSKHEDSTDMMIYAMGKKIYGLGLNTHVTTVVNRLSYAQRRFTDDMSDIEKLEIIREYAPYVVSPFNVTYNEDETVTIHNAWLREVLNGKKLTVNIVYNLQNETGDQIEIADLDETDLYAVQLNGALSGMNFSLKHSDRSIYYAYGFDGYNSPLINPIPDNGFSTPKEGFAFLANFIADQINVEVKIARQFKENFIPFQYFGKSFDKPGIASILGEERFNELVEGEEINNDDKNKIYKIFIERYYDEYLKELNKWKVLENNLGLSKVKLANYNNNIDLAITTAFINEIVNHISENRLFNNDLRFYKNPTDFFKRLSPTSSTGQVLVNDGATNDRIRQETARLTDIEIYNPLTNKMEVVSEYRLAPDGYMRGITLKENESYQSHLIQPATDKSGKPLLSKLTGKQESMLFMAYEWNELQDRQNVLSENDKENLIRKINGYVSKYANINENDGQSYMNIIAFKNYMIRLGQWTEGMENVFQVEMQIMKAKSIEDIYDIEIEIKGKKVKVFEIPKGQSFYERIETRDVERNGETVKVPFLQNFHPFHTLKTQYSGFSMSEQYLKESQEQIFDTSIFKTSQHILLPSAIIGTNLALMNITMIKNGIDIYHMGSANKVGGIDPSLSAKYFLNKKEFKKRKHLKSIAENGLEFYNEKGEFNHEAINENHDLMSYLFDVNFLKDQVRIGNKVKDKIKGSTQSLKIILSNLIINNKERFEGAREILEEYKAIISQIVNLNVEELNKELGSDGTTFTTKEELKKVLLSSQVGKGAPENILNSIENFIDDPLFEKLSNKGKIENILYALITNTAIVFNRPGNAYPQTASTGYEKAGTRNVTKNNNNLSATSNQDTIRFYTPVFEEDGSVSKIKPAEIILPLPDYWIESILNKYKTRNIAKAITMLNADIESGKVVNEVIVKGLRIPNQQLSSNDILKVKKFGLPTMQAYAIVPSEIVVKSGSDFDIDKINIYWTPFKDSETLSPEELERYAKYKEVSESLNLEPLDIETWMSVNGKKAFEAIDTDFLLEQNKGSKKSWIEKQSKYVLQARLLKLEQQLLLHPRNLHHLFMPVTDDIIASSKTGVYKKVWMDLEGNPATDSPDLLNSLMPHTQVRNGLIFVKGKFGVGIVALSITGHATSQTDGVEINKLYNAGETLKDTMLRFEGHETNFSLGNYADSNGNTITEILSQLLTTQVDNVKNPVGIKLGINNQTLNVVEYLIRRGVDTETIISFIKQPLIQEYLQEQRINESVSNKTNGVELNKYKLVQNILSRYYESKEIPEELFPDEPFIKINDLKRSIREKVFDINQIYYLNYFLELLDQTKMLSDFSQEQTPDTKAIINKTGYENIMILRKRSEFSEFIPIQKQYEVRTRGVLAPFTRARENYRTKFLNMYITNHPDLVDWFSNIKETIVNLQKTQAKKEKAGITFENDFILFFAMKYVLPQAKGYYNELFGLESDKDSLAKRIVELKGENTNNILLRSFLPLLRSRMDDVTQKHFDSLRLFERELTNLDTNDILDAMKEIAEIDLQLYKDIIVFTLMQSGFNNSPFNYLKIVPVGNDSKRGDVEEYEYVINDIMKDTIVAIHNSIQRGNINSDMLQFYDEFQRNNPSLLRAKTWNGYPLDYYIGFDQDKKMKLYKYDPNKRKSKEPAIILGSTLNKRYGLNETFPTEPRNEKTVTEDFEYAEYEDVTNNVELSTYEGKIKSLQNNEIFVFGSNPLGINGNPSKGTGGAALVAHNIAGVKQGEKMDNKLSESGKAWGITTVTAPGAKRSKTISEIKEGIIKLYDYAAENPDKRFLIAYTGKEGKNLNGYTNQELANMFSSFDIPSNIIFEKDFASLMSNAKPYKNSVKNRQVVKVISGGQTGVDRLGLEVGKSLGIQTGGTTTPGFITEIGKDISLRDEFGVQEITSELQAGKSGSEFYLPRTEQNVINSDGTVYFASDENSAGKKATERFAIKHKKPFILNPSINKLTEWLQTNDIKVLNVAGNRGSKLKEENKNKIKSILEQALNIKKSLRPEAKQLDMFGSSNLVTMREMFLYIYDIIGGNNSGRSKNPLLFIDNIIEGANTRNFDIGFIRNNTPEKSTFDRNKLLSFLELRMSELQDRSEKLFGIEENVKELKNILAVEEQLQLLYANLKGTKPERFDSIADDRFTFPEVQEAQETKKLCKGNTKIAK